MSPKMCIDKELPRDLIDIAASRAIDETPDNLPAKRRPVAMGVAPSPFRMALETGKKWRPGRTLRVAFLGGDTRVHERIAEHARRWQDCANIDFAFGSSPAAEIRIAFTNTGSWSYLGTDALSIPRDEATMNYGWLSPTLDDGEFERVVCHEFGHALAAIHEHQHPDGGIPWDRDAVYRAYADSQGWSRQEVDQQVFARYDRSITQYGNYDPASIMHYPVDEDLTLGDFSVGWNSRISAGDAAFMRVAYPAGPRAAVPLAIGAAPVTGEISAPGEVDTYTLELDGRRRVRLETTGATDLVMILAGPDDPRRVIAEDDDTGPGNNPRLTRTLQPGSYAVRVRHYSRSGKGSYAISASAL